MDTRLAFLPALSVGFQTGLRLGRSGNLRMGPSRLGIPRRSRENPDATYRNPALYPTRNLDGFSTRGQKQPPIAHLQAYTRGHRNVRQKRRRFAHKKNPSRGRSCFFVGSLDRNPGYRLRFFPTRIKEKLVRGGAPLTCHQLLREGVSCLCNGARCAALKGVLSAAIRVSRPPGDCESPQ